MLKIQLIALMIFSLAFGCRKPLMDSRSRYTGLYKVTIDRSSWAPGDTFWVDTTYTFEGVIELGDSGNSLVLRENDSRKYYFDLYEDGSFDGSGNRGYFVDYSHFDLEHSTNYGHWVTEISKLKGTRK